MAHQTSTANVFICRNIFLALFETFCFGCSFTFLDRVWLHSVDWSQTCDSPASPFRALGLQGWSILVCLWIIRQAGWRVERHREKKRGRFPPALETELWLSSALTWPTSLTDMEDQLQFVSSAGRWCLGLDTSGGCSHSAWGRSFGIYTTLCSTLRKYRSKSPCFTFPAGPCQKKNPVKMQENSEFSRSAEQPLVKELLEPAGDAKLGRGPQPQTMPPQPQGCFLQSLPA